MIDIKDKQACCGCEACANVCPVNAIKVVRDNEGVYYPEVDVVSCINCGKCEHVCPEMDYRPNNERFVIKAYGVMHKSNAVRFDSSSGGAFTLFAEAILSQGGIVCGCVLDENIAAKHICIEKIEDIPPLRGSKYVQSRLGDIYETVKGYLISGRKVLFVGTPCQCAGLNNYYSQENRGNLILVDFICHGVPSPGIFEDYIKYLERKNKDTVHNFKFRNKDRGWHHSGLQLGTRIETSRGEVIRNYPALKDIYMNGFLSDLFLRPSCYSCFIKEKGYCSDITIADFWGINKQLPGFDDAKGASLVIVRTGNGNELWNNSNSGAIYKEVDYNRIKKINKSLYKSADMTEKRSNFFEDYEKKGFEFVSRKYMKSTDWVLYKLASILKKYMQIVKFGIVGVSNTVVNLVVYYFGMYLGLPYLIAYTVAFLVSSTNAFIWNNKYVFKDKNENSIVKAYIKVVASYGVSFLISAVLMVLMVEKLHISSIIAPILKLALTIPINYLLNKKWAFKDTK